MQSIANTKAMGANSRGKSNVSPWLGNALTVAFGGMIFTCILQWMMKICAVAWHGGYNIDPDAKMWCMIPLLLMGVYVWLTINGGFGAATQKEKPIYSYSDDSSGTNGLVIACLFFGCGIGLINMPINWAILLICVSSIGTIGLMMLHMLYQDRSARRYASLTWLFGYLCLWVMSGILSSVSVLSFIIVWVILGALGGNAVTIALKKTAVREYHTAGHTWRTSDVSKEHVQRSRRARMTSSVVSQYGRVPQDTFDLFNQQVRRVTGPVASALPILSDSEVRNMTILEILTVTLRDWRENDNLQGLQALDVDDLRSFIEAAVSLAGDLQNKESVAIYKGCLHALLLDWLDNWNVDGRSGPPLRRSTKVK